MSLAAGGSIRNQDGKIVLLLQRPDLLLQLGFANRRKMRS